MKLHGTTSAYGAMGCQIDPIMVDPLSYFLFQPMLLNWCNNGCDMNHLRDGVYKRTLAANQNEYTTWGQQISSLLSGPLPYA